MDVDMNEADSLEARDEEEDMVAREFDEPLEMRGLAHQPGFYGPRDVEDDDSLEAREDEDEDSAEEALEDEESDTGDDEFVDAVEKLDLTDGPAVVAVVA